MGGGAGAGAAHGGRRAAGAENKKHRIYKTRPWRKIYPIGRIKICVEDLIIIIPWSVCARLVSLSSGSSRYSSKAEQGFVFSSSLHVCIEDKKTHLGKDVLFGPLSKIQPNLFRYNS